MLDVHPPHEAAHTWKDFFIHVATICVGLLIAVGLEQTVEWVHHKSEIRETRRLLKEEREQNVEIFHKNVSGTRYQSAALENDLRIFQYLQQHPGAPGATLPGIPRWVAPSQRYVEAAWTSAKQTNVLALMSQTEVEDSRELYERLNENHEREIALYEAVVKARAYEFVHPDPTRLTRAQVDAELLLIQDGAVLDNYLRCAVAH